jgi:beta-aspartyl-dipeptidase (metallo-type)
LRHTIYVFSGANLVSTFTPSLIMLRQADVYDPQHRGLCDVLIAGGKIAAIGSQLPTLADTLGAEEVDASGLKLIPGLIDGHAHLTGGGGESGFSTRVPRVFLSAFTKAGVTSVVGVLGADGTTRTVRDLVATTMGLREEGLSAWCYTGSYQIPVPTLTSSIRDDIVFIDPVIGVGELAISDHRSSQPTLDEFLRIASDVHAAGMITQKAGILHLHLGDGERGLDLIRQALKQAEIPARVYHPTHVNRQKALFKEAQSLAKQGVTVDVTAFPDADDGLLAHEAIDQWLSADLPKDKLTCSSDGGGCLPTFDANGEMIHMDVGRPELLTWTLSSLLEAGRGLEEVLPVFTTNVAKTMRLRSKGYIKASYDADVVCLDENNKVQHVLCNGQWMVRNGETLRTGAFERKEIS